MNDRTALLEELGRFYGEQHFAIAWTATNNGASGDGAKAVTTRGWQNTKPLADGDFAAGLFKERGQTRNPAIVLRPSGLVAVECDGAEELARVEALGLPTTLTVQSSAPDRQHRYFRPPAALEQVPLVDFRFEKGKVQAGSGRYFLCPPATHPSGAVYSFLPGLGPGEVEIAEMPEELYRRLAEQAGAAADGSRSAPIGDVIREGERAQQLCSLAGTMRQRGVAPRIILETLRATNREACVPPLPDAEVDGIATRYGGLGCPDDVTPVPPARSLDDVVEAFRRWLHLPDPGATLRRARDRRREPAPGRPRLALARRRLVERQDGGARLARRARGDRAGRHADRGGAA